MTAKTRIHVNMSHLFLIIKSLNSAKVVIENVKKNKNYDKIGKCEWIARGCGA